MSLTPKEQRFVEEYLIDLDPKRAAKVAGYSATMAATKAYQWVCNGKVKPHVFDAVRKAQDKRAERTGITQDRVLAELAKMAFTDLSDATDWGVKQVAYGFDAEGNKLRPEDIGDAALVRYVDAPFVTPINRDDLAPHIRSAVSEVALTKDGFKIKMHDKNAALVSLGRHLGMFNDKVQHTGEVTVNTVTRKIVD